MWLTVSYWQPKRIASPQNDSISSNLKIFLFLGSKILSSAKRREPRLSTDTSKPLFPNSCFTNKKDIVVKTILTLSAEAILKTAAKNKMCDFYFQNKDLDLIARQLHCHQPCYNHLLAATAVVFEKPLQ